MQSRTERVKANAWRVPRKPKFYKRKPFLIALMTIVAGMATAIGCYAYSLYSAVNHMVKPGDPLTAAAAWNKKDPVNILVMGVDNRNNDPHPRSDAMIVISINPVTKTAMEFSVMRDSYVKIPGYGFDKINAAYSLGGPNLAIQTVSDFLKIPINFYVTTDFQGFEKVVDTIGGVTINVEKDMVYADDGVYDINLHKGLQHLDGKHALMYVRFRHDATSDYTRTQRQRNFLKALAKGMETPQSLLKLPSIVNAMAPYVQTNMSVTDMVELGKLAYDINLGNVMGAEQIPTNQDLKEDYTPEQGDIIVPDVYATRVEVHNKLGLTGPIPNDLADQPYVTHTKSAVPKENTTPAPSNMPANNVAQPGSTNTPSAGNQTSGATPGGGMTGTNQPAGGKSNDNNTIITIPATKPDGSGGTPTETVPAPPGNGGVPAGKGSGSGTFGSTTGTNTPASPGTGTQKPHS